MDFPEGQNLTDHLDNELDQASPASLEPQQIILYYILKLVQKTQLWLIVGLSISGISNNKFYLYCIILPPTSHFKFNVPMSAETLSKIYHDPKDPGSLGNVKRLLQRARQLHVPIVT